MNTTNISLVINNYFNGGNTIKGLKVYSVIVSHQAETFENYLFTDKNKAIAKMEEVKNSWFYDDIVIHKYDEDLPNFTPQYKTKIGYSYENEGDMANGLWEYGCVEIIECVLE
jgi:hypothetical protein